MEAVAVLLLIVSLRYSGGVGDRGGWREQTVAALKKHLGSRFVLLLLLLTMLHSPALH